ncbi:hypothetical protein CGLO_15000 [Colletotrichum gloeosporioides Cg-14]|uniref:Uncharacterized protein n=1 Tax=Colletotrichum gloeosporioides (strain Cg-14) TaxID=1237896 RepID=T0L326_COLGC|nr:hypothetical protein CGLO_15000 [Colletotrichum gloeosporioides Cg-14]
MRRYYSLIEVL